MFDFVFQFIPTLSVAMATNILLGLYYNVGIKKSKFNLKTLLVGIIKILIIGISFISLGFCFDQTNLSSIGITPETIMNAAIILYVSKCCIKLSKILGIENISKK